MRYGILWLTSGLMVLLVFVGSALAQPPGDRGRPPGPGGLERLVDELKLSDRKRDTALVALRTYQDNVRTVTDLANSALLRKMKEALSQEEFQKLVQATDAFRGPGDRRSLTIDDVVARIMSFDKNNDGKVSKEELPERMQDLIAKGDTNKDGVLDKEEIRQLAADLAKEEVAIGRGPGPGGPPGPGGRGAPGDGIPAAAIQRAVNDLKLSEMMMETATAAVKAHQENVRTVKELARADLLLKIGDVLTEEELKKFEVALDRMPDPGRPPPGRRGPPGPPPIRP
jgi:hypothetical protein